MDNVVNSLPGFFYMFRLEEDTTRLVKWNKNYEAILGYSPDDSSTLSINDFIYEEDAEKYRNALSELFAKGYARVEIRLKTKDGKPVPIHRFEAFLFEDEEETYLIGTALEISDRVKAEQELQKAHQQLIENEKKYRSIFDNSPVRDLSIMTERQ